MKIYVKVQMVMLVKDKAICFVLTGIWEIMTSFLLVMMMFTHKHIVNILNSKVKKLTVLFVIMMI